MSKYVKIFWWTNSYSYDILIFIVNENKQMWLPKTLITNQEIGGGAYGNRWSINRNNIYINIALVAIIIILCILLIITNRASNNNKKTHL